MTQPGAAAQAGSGRWAWAEVDTAAIEHNVGVVRRAAAPSDVWAVVKADGYGHGAVVAAQAALRGGATGLCVALVQEGVALREAGIDAPVLVLSQQPPSEWPAAVAHHLTSTVYSQACIAGLAGEAAAQGVPHRVHLKVDTGMHRVGCAPGEVTELAQAITVAPGLQFEGVFTHLAVADEPSHPANAQQLAAFDDVLAGLATAGLTPPLVHAANSAGALALPATRHSLVRAGIAIYGISPGSGVDALAHDVRPALALHARVAHVQRLAPGEHVSYGWRHTVAQPTTIATVPIGYADGVPRRLWATGGEVLIGGKRRPIVGVVTMDQLMVAVGDDEVAVGAPVVLIGEQGGERITAAEWAERLGTIGYEIVCGISRRITRHTR